MKVLSLVLLSVFTAMALAGCEGMSAPYVMKVDRVDQKMNIGNRGYLKGTPPPLKDRGALKRPFIAIDVDLVEPEGEKKESVEKEEVVYMKEKPEPALGAGGPVADLDIKKASQVKEEEIK